MSLTDPISKPRGVAKSSFELKSKWNAPNLFNASFTNQKLAAWRHHNVGDEEDDAVGESNHTERRHRIRSHCGAQIWLLFVPWWKKFILFVSTENWDNVSNWSILAWEIELFISFILFFKYLQHYIWKILDCKNKILLLHIIIIFQYFFCYLFILLFNFIQIILFFYIYSRSVKFTLTIIIFYFGKRT